MAMNPRLLRPLASGFNPRSISGLALWLDSLDAATLLNSVSPQTPAAIGETVRQWRDKSGNSRHANQTNATLQPTRQSTGISFDGTGDHYDLTDYPELAKNIGYIGIFAVGRYRSLPGAAETAIFSASRNSSIVFARVFFGTLAAAASKLRTGGRRQDADTLQAVTSTADVPVVDAVLTGLIDYSNAAVSQRLNGSVDGSSSSFQTAGVTDNTNPLGIFIARSGSTYAGIDLREMLIYTSPLSASQVAAVERYLGARWGVTLA
jgi:hypothetical protein